MQKTALHPFVKLGNGQYDVLATIFGPFLCYERALGRGQAGWKSVYHEEACGDYHRTQAGAVKCLLQRAGLVGKD